MTYRADTCYIKVMNYVFDHSDKILSVVHSGRFGLFVDYDGTISKIVPNYKEAQIDKLCKQYLVVLCEQLPMVAAVSGRAAATIQRWINIDKMIYVGNHGMERWQNGKSVVPQELREYSENMIKVVHEITPLLDAEGIFIEDKNLSIAIHYRMNPNHEQAEIMVMQIASQAAAKYGLQIMHNKMIVELVPPTTINKGAAINSLIKEYGLDSAIYIGDDVTDIDAFKAIRDNDSSANFHGLALGVISRETPAGLTGEINYSLNSVDDVARFLKFLADNTAKDVQGKQS